MKWLRTEHIPSDFPMLCNESLNTESKLVISYDCSADLASQLVHAPEQSETFNWESLGSGNGQPFIVAQLHATYWYQGYVISASFIAWIMFHSLFRFE